MGITTGPLKKIVAFFFDILTDGKWKTSFWAGTGWQTQAAHGTGMLSFLLISFAVGAVSL